MHYLDKNGRHAISPSLYDRDAYQAWLRSHRDKIDGICFDVLWNAKRCAKEMELVVELVTTVNPKVDPLVIRKKILPPRLGFLGKWTRIELKGEDFVKEGDILAWRVMIIADGQPIAEERSFLW